MLERGGQVFANSTIFRICFFFFFLLALFSIHYRSRARAERAPSSSYPSKSTEKCVVSTCSVQVGIDRIVDDDDNDRGRYLRYLCAPTRHARGDACHHTLKTAPSDQ